MSLINRPINSNAKKNNNVKHKITISVTMDFATLPNCLNKLKLQGVIFAGFNLVLKKIKKA